ncbi:putative regulatory subunit of the poly(A)-nuclease (PAN) deadenylation complex, one of two cytoplasmic mRNA deadenylases involved in mRNA turnover [Lyophyllum shimeji]|uniref:PAN2-PAN3 deadenylation complex subunit PAN3 n=1 Tax=Lyophyllum shimeji TaxID=47721 RepID=A0A9P3PZ37_LYOSH|nr:putative regulatory subunit of the poly(A)-nuclease (PAN) deadenylation complex, one of two cytoplasmic mRNA deadenylases involved in mRNA turnover [Lyophyllum shimeji]
MAFFARPQSTAVRIVDPNSQDELKAPKKDSTQRKQCRNIMIHGYCKFQDKGCIYSHPSPETPSPGPASPSPQETRTSTITPRALNAPVFVPKALAAATPPPPPPLSAEQPLDITPAGTSPIAQGPPDFQGYEGQEAYDPYAYPEGENGLSKQMEELDPHFYDDNQYVAYSEYDPNALDASYYSPVPPVYMRQPLDYHLYTPAPPAGFVASTSDSHLIAPIGSNLPDELQGYHTLVPLESTGDTVERRKLGNWYSTVYRAIRSSDGLPYALRRIENYRLMHQSAFSAIEIWSRIQHPNIITVKEAFTTRSFNDNSLVFVHTYHADAQTLFDVHLKPKPPTMQTHYQHGRSQHLQAHLPTIIPERTIWSYIVQIASAIKKVHDVGQAVRMIDVTKILVTGQNRIRISSCGVIDVLLHDTPQDIGILQQEDLTMFGRLLFALCCNNVTASSGQNFQKSLDFMGRNYSPDIKNVALFLISKGGPHRSIDQLLDLIRGNVVVEMEDALNATDRLENELLSELENARLVRLLCKFGFINERPEFAREPRWSETGDRYIIKLFRDYVFHQVDEHGNPVVNLSHVLVCLNKLDAGTDEKVMLVARDEQSCLIVSYKEIKRCIEEAFGDLTRASTKHRR